MMKGLSIIRKSETTDDRVFKILILSIIGLFVIINIICQFQNVTYKPFFISILVSICYLIFLYFASKCLHSDKIALIFLCLISLIILVGWNFLYRPQPTSDYLSIWNGAHYVLDGSFFEKASDKTNYFYFYSFQIGFTYYCSLFLKIFDSLITLKIVEIVTLVAVNVVLYKSLRPSSSIGVAFFGSVLFTSYPFIFVCSGIINNQHIGLLLGALSVYLVFKKDNYLTYIISAFLLVVGNVLRPSTIMIFASVLFVLFFQGFQDRKKWIKILAFTGVFIVGSELINLSFIVLYLAPYGIKSSDLYFKLLLGLSGGGVTSRGTGAWYIVEDLKHFNYDYTLYREACKNYLIDLFIGGKLDFHFIISKIIWYISGIDNQTSYSGFVFSNNHGLWMDYLNFTGMIIYIISLLGSFFCTLKQKRILNNTKYFLPAVVFCAYFGVYVIFEAMPRYRFEQYYFLFILSVPTIYGLINKIVLSIKRIIFSTI